MCLIKFRVCLLRNKFIRNPLCDTEDETQIHVDRQTDRQKLPIV
jgi:hypothetical protein